MPFSATFALVARFSPLSAGHASKRRLSKVMPWGSVPIWSVNSWMESSVMVPRLMFEEAAAVGVATKPVMSAMLMTSP